MGNHDTETAMIAAQRTINTNYEEPSGHQFPHHVSKHYRNKPVK